MSDTILTDGINPPFWTEKSQDEPISMRRKVAISQIPDAFVDTYPIDENNSQSTNTGKVTMSRSSETSTILRSQDRNSSPLRPVSVTLPCPGCSIRLDIQANNDDIQCTLNEHTQRNFHSRDLILELFSLPHFVNSDETGRIIVATEAELLSYIRKIFVPSESYLGKFPTDRLTGLFSREPSESVSMTSTPNSVRRQFYEGTEPYLGTFHSRPDTPRENQQIGDSDDQKIQNPGDNPDPLTKSSNIIEGKIDGKVYKSKNDLHEQEKPSIDKGKKPLSPEENVSKDSVPTVTAQSVSTHESMKVSSLKNPSMEIDGLMKAHLKKDPIDAYCVDSFLLNFQWITEISDPPLDLLTSELLYSGTTHDPWKTITENTKAKPGSDKLKILKAMHNYRKAHAAKPSIKSDPLPKTCSDHGSNCIIIFLKRLQDHGFDMNIPAVTTLKCYGKLQFPKRSRTQKK